MSDEHDVSRIALSFPAASQEGTGFRVNQKSFAWVYQQKVAGQKGRTERRDVLAIRVATLEEKDALIAADPKKFFTDDHYTGYPAILVRLAAIQNDELTELLADAWRLRAPRKVVAEWDKD